MPRANLTSSDIMSGPKGGSNVVMISHTSTPSTDSVADLMSSIIMSAAGQNAEVSVWVIFAVGKFCRSMLYINPRS